MKLKFAAWALLTATILVASCGQKETVGENLAARFRPLIPADTKVLADIKLDRLKATALYQRHASELALLQLDRATQELGIDPRRDLAELVVAWNGKSALFLVRGSFDAASVQQHLRALKAAESDYESHKIFAAGENSVAFLAPDLVAIGPVAIVRNAVDAGSGEGFPEELQEKLKGVSPADQIWLVSRGLPFADAPMRSDVQSALSNIVDYISGASAGISVDSGTHFGIDLSCISEAGAKRVHDALRGAIGLGRLSTKDNQTALLAMYDAIHVEQDKTHVRAAADYSAALTEQLIQQVAPARQATSR